MGANEKHEAVYHGKDQADAPLTEKPSLASPAGATSEQKTELGPVGKWALGVVAMATVVPFLGILWAWAAGVVRSLGGLW